MEDNDGFIPLKKNENGVFTPVEDDGFIPVTKTSDGIFVSAEEKKKSVANQSDAQPVLQTPSEQPMRPSSESGQEDKGLFNKIGDAFSGAWNKVLSGQGLFGTEREALAQQKQLEQRQNAIDLAIAKRNETERLKNEAVQKSDLVRENLKQYKAESDAVEYAAQFPEYKQLQQIEAAISAMGKPSNPQQQAQYNALLAEREKLLDTDVSKRDVFAESGPKLEIKNPSDFATASEYADYQNKLFNQFSRFSKEKEKFDTAKPKFEAATKLRDVLDVAQKSQTKASWIADKVKSIQKESDDYINAARELNKDRLEPLGFTKAFVDGIQQTSLANSIADIYALGNDDKLLKSLENIYIDNAVFPKETTALGSVGELIGGQVEPLAIGIGGGALNPIAGVVGATAEYARLGAGGQLIDAYTTARQQGMTASEALEVAKKTAIAGGVGGAVEGLAGAVTFGGKPAKELATMGFKQAVKEALKDNSIDAVIAGINQTVQNKNMQRLGLDVETDRGVIENMSAELLFGAGMNLAMYGGSKVKGYGTLINGIAKMPLADIQLQVDNAVKQGVLNEANAQRFVSDVSKSKEAQDKLQGIDIPEANQDKAIDLQKEIDDLEAKKKTASPAILPAIENKVEALTGELQIVAGVPLTMQERAELNRLQTARDTNTEYDKDRLGVLEARQKAASEKEVIVEPKIQQDAEEQQSGTLRGESQQVQTQGQRDSDMPIVNEAKLQDGQVVEEVAPPVVEQTTTDVGGVTAPSVSEALKDVESTTKAFDKLYEEGSKEFDDIEDMFIDAGLTNGEYDNKDLSEAYHKAKADGSNPELVKAVEEALSKPNTNETTPTKEVSNEGNSALRDVEAQKADIKIGKVSNTEYEVKSDGVYYKDKKLDNPKNLSHKELITEDIRRRKKEELNAKDKQSGKFKKDLDVYIIEKRRIIDEFIKNKGENLESIDGWNDLRGDIQELLFEGKFDEAKAKVPQTYEEKINAKYNAELAELEKQQPPQGKGEGDWSAEQQRIENDKTLSAEQKEKAKIESTAKALDEKMPFDRKRQEAVNLLPTEKVNYKDIKGIGDLSQYLNNPEALKSGNLRSAYKIYKQLKNGEKIKDKPYVSEDNELMDGQNRIAAQLALGNENVDVVKIGKSFFDKSPTEQISEAYHKAKADGSNPELVKAVEELLRRPTETKSQVSLQSQGQSKLTPEIPLSEQKSENKGVETTLNEQKDAGQGKAGLQESDGGAERKSQPRQKSATTESTQITPETKAKFEQAQRLYEEIANAEGGTKKRQLASERKKFLDENPTIKFIDDNIKSITSQLEKAGRLIKKGDCP